MAATDILQGLPRPPFEISLSIYKYRNVSARIPDIGYRVKP